MVSAGFLDVTGRNDAPTCVLAHIVTPSSVSYYLSSAPYVSGDSAEGEDAPTNIAYTPIISGFPRVRIGIDDFLSGQASVSWGELVLATDENVSDMFGTPGASITLFVAVAPQYRGLSTATAKFPSSAWRECILIGKVSHFRTNQNRTVSITIQSETRSFFDQKVCNTLFSASNTPTIPAENIGKPIPITLGQCRNVSPTLIDASALRFQASSAAVTVDRVSDGGLPLILTGNAAAYDADPYKLRLASSASSTAGYYIGAHINLLTGPGSTGRGRVTAYDGSTKTATMQSAWSANPTTSTTYELELWTYPLTPTIGEFTLLSPYTYNITADVRGQQILSPFGHGTAIEVLWYIVLGRYISEVSDTSGVLIDYDGIFLEGEITIGDALSALARAAGAVWAMIPQLISGSYVDALVVRPIKMPTSAAVATFDSSTILSYDLALDTDVIWRATGRDKKTWTATEQNAANSQLPVAEREWLKAGYVRNVYENTSAATRYGAREIEVETLRYDSGNSTATLTQLVTFFSGAIRKRLRITVPAFFPSPILMDKITVTMPDNVSTYSGDYDLTGWTTYTDSN